MKYDYNPLLDKKLQKLPNLLSDVLTKETGSDYPTTADIDSGRFSLWWNTATSIMRLYYNDAGSLRYVQFTNPAAGANVYGTAVYGTGTYDV